jgi:carboxyl-terminal processing protease
MPRVPKLKLKRSLPIALVLIVACAGGIAGSLRARAPEPLDDAATQAAVTKLTAKLLEGSQFAHRQIDAELASKFLDGYLDELDSQRLVLLQSDVAEFEQFKATLADTTRRMGDTRPARIIFARYLQRVEQRAAFLTEALKTEKFDFTADERYAYDRETAPRPANIREAQRLWLQQLRLEYLQEKLAGKSKNEIEETLARRIARLPTTMKKLSNDAVIELYLNALAHVYDPHSDYMGREQLESFKIAMNLSLAGIGAALGTEDGYCVIRELLPGGPAFKSNQLKTADRIVGVAQGMPSVTNPQFVDVVDMPLSQIVDLIRGPKGTGVQLQVIPAGAADDSVRKTVALVRDDITLEAQQAKALIVDLPATGAAKNVRVGVIDLPGFYAGMDKNNKRTSATADVARLITKLKKENVAGIVLDLRANGGGVLQEAIDLTGLFIPSGPVVQTRDLAGRVEVGDDQDGGAVLYDGPLVVLTSRFSASASEIVAGALQDYGRAVIVGDPATFGKGTVQSLVPLAEIMQREGLVPSEDPGALKVTISKFYRPSGASTQLKGVVPDFVLPSLTDIPEVSEADLDNPLPWDTIPAARFSRASRVTPAIVSALAQRSSARTSKDAAFSALLEEKERMKKLRAEKTISLNEEKRRKEKAESEARTEARKKAAVARVAARPPTYEITMKTVDAAGPGELVKAKPKPAPPAAPPSGGPSAATPDDDDDDLTRADDLVLGEGERILADLVSLSTR